MSWKSTAKPGLFGSANTFTNGLLFWTGNSRASSALLGSRCLLFPVVPFTFLKKHVSSAL